MCWNYGLVVWLVYLWLRSKTSLAPYWGLSRWKRTWWSRIELSWNWASTPMLHFDWISTWFPSSKFFLFFKNILEKRFILKITLACRYIAFKFRGFCRTTPRVHSYRFFWTVQSSFSVKRNRRDRWCLLRQPENSAGTLCVERPIYFPFFSFSSRHMLSAMGLLTAVSQSAAGDVKFLSRVQYNAAFDRLPLARAVHTKTHVDEGRQKPIVIEFDRSSVDGQFHFASDPFFKLFLSHCCSWFLRTRLSLH